MVQFGMQLWQEEHTFPGLQQAWQDVEAMGYDSCWLYDHFYPMSNETSRDILEPWTLLPSLAAVTARMRLGVLVTCASYRRPAVLAKIAATVDLLSAGRLEFGIGAGWHVDEYAAYGIPFPPTRTRIAQLAEAVTLITRIWTQEAATFRGTHHQIHDLVAYPKPLQRPHPPLWIGGKGDATLRVVAQHADYANFVDCSVEEYRQRLDVLRRHCTATERPYDRIVKTWHGPVVVTATDAEAKRVALQFQANSAIQRNRATDPAAFLDRIIVGTPAQCIAKIRRYMALGVTYFITHFPFATDLRAHRVFMEQVASQVR
jgi:F420-dependent oxidoreductase-like protein